MVSQLSDNYKDNLTNNYDNIPEILTMVMAYKYVHLFVKVNWACDHSVHPQNRYVQKSLYAPRVHQMPKWLQIKVLLRTNFPKL